MTILFSGFGAMAQITFPPMVNQHLRANVRADRVTRLRSAFDAALSDPAFLNEADKAKIDLNPVGGDELSQIVRSSLALPSHLVDKVRAALSP